MKLLQVLFLAPLFGVSLAFIQPTPSFRHCETKLYGLFDFTAFHGGGSSGKEDLDEQWETQQAILASRRDHVTKDHLKEKYSHREIKQPTRSTNEVKVIEDNAAKEKPKVKFFWEN
jgi:hypothetical protein